MPSLTTEGSRAASWTKANKQALWIDFKFEISALMLPNDISAVRGRSQDRRSGTFNSGETPSVLAPAAVSDRRDSRPPILPNESLCAIVTSPGEWGNDKWAAINAFESLIFLSRLRTVALIKQHCREEKRSSDDALKTHTHSCLTNCFMTSFPVCLTSQPLSLRWVEIQWSKRLLQLMIKRIQIVRI